MNTITGINRTLDLEESSGLFWCGVVFGVVKRGAAAQGEKLGRKIICKGNNAREKRIYKITLR